MDLRKQIEKTKQDNIVIFCKWLENLTLDDAFYNDNKEIAFVFKGDKNLNLWKVVDYMENEIIESVKIIHPNMKSRVKINNHNKAITVYLSI